MPFGTQKREREYEKLKGQFKKSGRYKGRETEVAARIVNKQRSQQGETKGNRHQGRRWRSPDRELPMKEYEHLTVAQVKRQLSDYSRPQLKKIKRYEETHKHRRTLLEAIDRQLQ